jgi:murein DD-endopeptidase MepM/ murein hydrolase activator NlpD
MRDWRTHDGLDIQAPLGQTVCAAMPGVVRFVQDDGFYGTFVTVDHGDGTCAVYANLASMPAVSVGDWVQAGDVIGAVGTTALCEIGQGTHLHFAVYLDGESVDPLDYLPA